MVVYRFKTLVKHFRPWLQGKSLFGSFSMKTLVTVVKEHLSHDNCLRWLGYRICGYLSRTLVIASGSEIKTLITGHIYIYDHDDKCFFDHCFIGNNFYDFIGGEYFDY